MTKGFLFGNGEIRTLVRFSPQTDFEQLSHRLSLSLTVPNFRKIYRISDRFLAPSEKNARLIHISLREHHSRRAFLFGL